MEKKSDSHDWAAYYQAAYEREKKKNTVLAGKIADAEAKESDLMFSLGRIQNSVFWRMLTPARKCYHMLTGGGKRRLSQGSRTKRGLSGAEESFIRSTEAVKLQEAVQAYEQEVYRQKHPYLQWIKQYEQKEDTNTEYNNMRNGKAYQITGWHQREIPDTDLCIVACGNGMLAAKIEEKIKSWFNKNESCLFAYADEDYYWEIPTNRMHPWYKPCYSPDTLLAFCYIGHMLITKQMLYDEFIREKGGEDALSYSDFYDLCLRLEEKAGECGGSIFHIEEVLFHNCYEPDKQAAAQIEEARQAGADVLERAEEQLLKELENGRGMLGCDASCMDVREAALHRRGIRAHLQIGPIPDIYHVAYELPDKADAAGDEREPMISVVIPSKDHPDVLERCLSSFREKTDYGNYEWIVVDNGSSTENKSRMEALQKEYGFCYLYEPMEFNFSAMCNLGVSRAKGDYILLLNDDVEIIEKDWLRIMAGQAGQAHTGAVGAKLWYADSDAIQHAGITNMNIGPSHKLITFPDDRNYYYGHNQVTYNMIGVTAACLMVAKSKYQEVGGLDETMKVAYNDVDFCFKLIEAGYYNVLRNDAILYHYESLSRGLDEQDDNKWERLLCEKENLYAKHPAMQGRDDFYHKSLIDNASNYVCNFKFDYENNLKTTEVSVENARNLAVAQEGVLQLTIDRAEKQHKIHREEPDIMYVMGWCYIPGKDNAKYVKKLVLQQENGDFYTADICPWFRRDAAAVLSGEVNISLAGFVLRVKKEKLHFGTWRIGMLAIDLETNHRLLTWSDKKMTVI
ncbi:MAG: glycosyltransferase family 2 protein [Clostridium sp.]|nr:glycosyltransferase family 2 protein [Clostridium sp.]